MSVNQSLRSLTRLRSWAFDKICHFLKALMGHFGARLSIQPFIQNLKASLMLIGQK